MERYRDWPQRLTAYIVSTSKLPFEPGVMDCGLFAAGAVEAMTGIDPAAHLRGQYVDTKQGVVLTGKARLSKFTDSLFERCERGKAKRGDLGWVVERMPPKNHLQGALMVVDGATMVTVGGRRRPLSASRIFWSVG